MKLVSRLLQAKGHEVWSVTPDTSIYDALKLMADKNVGALLVLEADKLIGIFSERDYARKVILKGKASKDTPVKEIMSTKVLYIRPEQSIDDCMALMTDKRIRHLPVLDDDQLVGLISIGDVVKAIISEQEFMIKQLENYITGTL
ncbi:MAG: CBS domain-containing protein [bacterium]